MITRISGDVTKSLPKSNNHVQLLVHCVNSAGVWGSGVVVAINKELDAMFAYESWFENMEQFCPYRDRKIPAELGEVIFYDTGINNIIVCHCVGQKSPGSCKEINGKIVPPVRLWAMLEAMYEVRALAEKLIAEGKDVTIIGPEFCGLRAGADFNRDIIPLIEKAWHDLDVVIFSYDESKVNQGLNNEFPIKK